MKMTPQNEVFLKSFGILPITREIPEIPSKKGNIWKGIASAVRVWLIGQEKIDMSLFRINDAPHPSDVLFGDMWGTNYPTEKRMLDHVIHYIRTEKISSKGIMSYLKPWDQIVHLKGLVLDYNSELLSSNEVLLIKEYLKLNGLQDRDAKQSEDFQNDIVGIQSLCSFIIHRQKTLKNSKDFIKGLISDRITSVYKPYQGREKEKIKKVPVKNLIEKIKGSDDYRPFNPTRLCSLMNITPMPSVFVKNTDFLSKQEHNFCEECVSKGFSNNLIANIVQDYKTFMNDLKN
jgi:hypothetical protein